MIINIYSIPPLVAFILLSLLSFLVIKNNRKSILNVLFALACLSGALWLFSDFMAFNFRDINKVYSWFKVAYIGIIFIPVFFFHYTQLFLGIRQSKFFVFLNYIIGFLLAVINWNSCLLIRNPKIYFWGYYPIAGILHPLFIVFFFCVASSLFIQLLIFCFISNLNNTSIRIQQGKYILSGFILFTFAFVDFLPNYGVSIYPFGYLPTVLFVAIITYAIIRYRLMDISLAITRTGVFIALYSLILGLPFIIGFRFQHIFITLFGDKWWLVPMGLLTVLATVGPFIYIFIEKKAEERLLREQREYQNTLRKASGGMIRVRDLSKLLNLIVHMLTRTVKIEFAAIYLFDSDSNQYKMSAKKDGSSLLKHFALDNKSVIIQYLRLKREAVVYEEVQLQSQDSPQDTKLADLEKNLRELKSAVVVPSFVGNKLLGFLVLGKKLSGKLYSQDDLNVFSVLANQMALAIENALSHEEIRDTRSQLMQLEKLAMTGKLANSVAHELRNPLTAIKTFTEYLDQNYDNKEFRDKFKDIVNSEVDRLQSIASQLLDTAKIDKPHFKDGVDAHRIIEAVLFLLEKELSSKGIHLEVKFNAKKFNLKADPDQLKQCILNLIINGMQALQREQVVERRIIVSTVNPNDVKFLIEVADTGVGIPESDLPHIFEQFFTTKDKGTGLGLSIVQGIILAHNGKINCQSQIGKGTTFRIEFPLV